jgi:Kdo2-lipid IVA lauroyltransferase/acyltransferase
MFYLCVFPHLKNLLPALFYYLCLPFIYLTAILPFPLLYLFSDLVYWILYRLLGYRRGVVRANLVNSFPDKTEAAGYFQQACR